MVLSAGVSVKFMLLLQPYRGTGKVMNTKHSVHRREELGRQDKDQVWHTVYIVYKLPLLSSDNRILKISVLGGSRRLHKTPGRPLKFPPSLSPLAVAQTSRLGLTNKAYKV